MRYQLILDYWEGQGDIDEALLRREEVIGFIIRLNDMRGGHHLDVNFEKNWFEAGALGRAVYFVYNPWNTGEENFNWYMAHAPKGAAMAVDVEVRRPEYSIFTYGKELLVFLALLKKHNIRHMVYTGGGYTDMLYPWPLEENYWYARYLPYFWYPTDRTVRAWSDVRAMAEQQWWCPYGSAKTLGNCNLWQISGDRLVMPGTGLSGVDISLYNGTADAWLDWCGRPVYQYFFPTIFGD